MLKKMKAQDYYLPDSLGLTSECKSLLQKLLHPDWTKRCKIPEIMQDPWFRTDLPPDALNMNDRYIANTRACTQSEDGTCLFDWGSKDVQQAGRCIGQPCTGGAADLDSAGMLYLRAACHSPTRRTGSCVLLLSRLLAVCQVIG